MNKDFKIPPPSLPRPVGPAAPRLPQAGDEIDGRYRLVKKIGVGTSGAVYEGVQLSVDRRVAIKILKPGHYHDENYRERFSREAKAIARLSHTNCIALHDFGFSDDIHSLYMVMEYVDGVELFELMQSGEVGFVRSLRIAIQIAEALSHAHRLGILHRDLKPENVVVGKEDVIKVLDFGLARMLDLFGDDSGRRLTADGTIYGTPAYMSPEQCGGEVDVTVHSDIYSLGIILYQLFEGRLPFDSREIVAILIKHKTEPPPPMQTPVPERLKALIFRMLEKDKNKRPKTAYEVADILRAILLNHAMRDDKMSPDVSQEIQLSFLKSEIDESREFFPDTYESQRSNEYGLQVRNSGKHRAIRAIMTGRGKTEHLPGQLLNNRYKIIAELGSGIMSTVFVAEDVEEKKTVAVKVLSADLPPEFRASERFGREIEMLDALEHPNIIRLLGHGFDLSLDRHFLVMELASGDTLDTLCEEHRTSLDLAMHVAYAVTDALAYAHRSGVVHRDVKPSNVMLVPCDDGTVSIRVLDFGLALMHAEQSRLTEHGTVPGTVAYFAPERLKGQDATTAADMYSLGVVLYTCLCGHPPYEDKDSVRLAARILKGGAAPLKSFVHEVPSELSDLIMQMMDPVPTNRPQADQVKERLESIWHHHHIAAVRVQHKGPAADPVSAWKLRRRVEPPNERAPQPTNPEVPVVSRADASDSQQFRRHETIIAQPAPEPWRPTPAMILIAVLVVVVLILAFSTLST